MHWSYARNQPTKQLDPYKFNLVSAVVPDNTMRDALTSTDSSELIVEHLIDLANSFGGPDNITVILIDVAAGPEGSASPPLMLGVALSRSMRGQI
jgi:serine/threonine protein phosphatase PrpC